MIIQKPEPEMTTITLGDLDVAFDAHDIKPLTLYPKDELTIEADGTIQVTFREKSQETVVLSGRQIRWHALRERQIRVPIETESK